MVCFDQDSCWLLDMLCDLCIWIVDGCEVFLLAVVDVEFVLGLNCICCCNGMWMVMVMVELFDLIVWGVVEESLLVEFWLSFDICFLYVFCDEIGQVEGECEFMQEVMNFLLFVLVFMYLLLVIVFWFYFQLILIMIVILFVLMGVIFGYFIYDILIVFFFYFGVGVAVGVVINDNFVLIDFVNCLWVNGVGVFQVFVDVGV